MTDSSTEKSESAEQPAGTDKQVPIQAVAKERAEKRAARAEVQKLSEELEQARQAAGFDEETLTAMAQKMAEEARRAVEAELKPFKDEATKWKMAAKFGLNESQVEKVQQVLMQNPTLNETQALTLARTEHADLFPTQKASSWSPALGGLPVSGNPARMSDKPNFVEKMNEAVRNGDRVAARQFAQEEALDRFRRVFMQSRNLR